MVHRTMYQPLIEYLAIQSERDVSLSFVEIEAIIGRPLSVSVLIDSGVWHKTTQPQVRRWREIGWRATTGAIRASTSRGRSSRCRANIR